jgi:hypothetical protein
VVVVHVTDYCHRGYDYVVLEVACIPDDAQEVGRLQRGQLGIGWRAIVRLTLPVEAIWPM